MKRPETTGADISTPDKSEALISLLDEYIDYLEVDLKNIDEDRTNQSEHILQLKKENQQLKDRYHPVEFPFDRAVLISDYMPYEPAFQHLKSKITGLPDTQIIPGELVVVLKNYKQANLSK